MSLLALLALLAPAHAGECTETIESADGPAALKSAIEDSSASDVICIGGGTFAFTGSGIQVTVPSHDLTIRGSGVDETILTYAEGVDADGGGSTWMFEIDGGTITFEALTLDGAEKRRLIGVESGSLALDNVVVRNGRRGLEGAGVRLREDALLTVRASLFENNHATGADARGGHIYHYGIDDLDDDDVVLDIEDTRFVNGRAKRGGAIAIDGGRVEIRRSQFLDNQAELHGSGSADNQWGGGALNLDRAEYLIQDSRMEGNAAAHSGGAILAKGASPGHIERTNFIDNEALAGRGGHIFADGPDLMVGQSRFWLGRAMIGGAIACRDSSDCSAADSGFWYNEATNITNDSSGGAVSLRSSHGAWRRNLFCGNTATAGEVNDSRGGGAIFIRAGDGDFSNSVYVGNRTDSYGGALFIRGGGSTRTVSEYDLFIGNDANRAGAVYSRNGSNHATDDSLYARNVCSNSSSRVIEGQSPTNKINTHNPWAFENSPLTPYASSNVNQTGTVRLEDNPGLTPLPTFPISFPEDPADGFEDCRTLYDLSLSLTSGDPLFDAEIGPAFGSEAGIIDDDGDGISWLFDCDDDFFDLNGHFGPVYADLDGDGFGAGELLHFWGCPGEFEAINNLDCDDEDDKVFPGAAWICDGVINDCDLDALDPDEIDGDGDGYVVCEIPGDRGWLGDESVVGGGDCDDTDDRAFPGVATAEAEGLRDLCLRDRDGDGWGDAAAVSPVVPGNDCDDTRDFVFPGAPERCDGIINNCDLELLPLDESDEDGDGYVACEIHGGGWLGEPILGGEDCDDDDEFAFPTAGFNEPGGGALLCMRDFDGDGFGDDATGEPFEPGTDCDDTDPTVFPGAPELCDGKLNRCEAGPGIPDDEADRDADGFVVCAWSELVWVGADTVIGGGDCDDMDARTFPGVAFREDPSINALCLRDRDEDGWGDAEALAPVIPGTDCDDSDPTIFPGAEEICDGILTNCLLGELPTDEADEDGDRYVVCAYDAETWRGDEAILGGLDCDDTNPLVFPGARERCDGIINDCNTAELPDDEADRDEDGFVACTLEGWVGSTTVIGGDDCDDLDALVFPGATEICDGVLNNCEQGPDVPADEADLDGDLFVVCDREASERWVGDAAIVGGLDCDDTDARAFPGVATAEGEDLRDLCLRDTDEDGFGDAFAAEPIVAGTDCDDDQPRAFPGVAVNEEPELAAQCLIDRDRDGYGDFFAQLPVTAGTDCDDRDASVVPGTRGWDESCQRTIEQDGSRPLPEDSDEPPLTGCACSSSSPAGPGWLLLGLGALIGLVRRRGRG